VQYNDSVAKRRRKIYCFPLVTWALREVDQKCNSGLICSTGEYQLDRSCEKLLSTAWSPRGKEYPTYSYSKAKEDQLDWSHLAWEMAYKTVIGGNIEQRI